MSGETTIAAPSRNRPGDLIAQRFAAAGRHQRQRVAAARHMQNGIFLATAKIGEAEHARHLGAGFFFERGGGGRHSRAKCSPPENSK